MNVERTGIGFDTDPFKVTHHRLGRARRAELNEAEARGLRECAERRARVLAFPELARELTLPPLSYTTPEHWNGYVPPAFFDGQANDSARRRALVLLGQTVAHAEKEASE